jgi:hypothetical protein
VEGSDGSELDSNTTVGDCVLFALLQFSKMLYATDLADGLPGLEKFYHVMEKRPSTKVEKRTFPVELRMIASRWVKETNTPLEKLGEIFQLTQLYLVVLIKMASGLIKGYFGQRN